MNLGENIQRLRKEKGLSQEYVAQKIGISRQSISLWEKNKTVPSIENLVTLSEILGVTVDELLGREAA
ncbi:MAG: helix-turn-helix domain-containing protein [Anaeromassilibacillus sp.]|nr:helix-turn-helix domain-containing protein [Anaeromassilibacillus sp.]MDY3780279.1 helix-turn-helix transcriptional regulator [Candidatus Limousia pullorum]